MRNKALLKSALTEESALQRKLKSGLGAFSSRDKSLVAQGERPRVGDSLNLDEAMKPDYPDRHRWDYLLSVRDTGAVIGVEPHSATDGDIEAVIQKKSEAASYLRSHFRPGCYVERWLWVSHGKTRFSKTERATKQLASKGIEYVGRSITNLG